MTTVMVLTPGNAAETHELDPNSTVGELLNTLVENGKIANPDEVKILNERSEGLSGDDVIGENRAISFITRLAGA